MLTQDAEKIIGRDDLALALLIIILQKSVEGVIADACAKFFKKVRALKINCVGIWAKSLAFVNGNIHKTFGLVKIDAISPPPTDEVWMQAFVVDTFRVRGK